MDVTTLTTIAKLLGIKLTNAEEGTEVYEAWKDRVEQANEYDLDINHARNLRSRQAQEDVKEFTEKRDAAISEANRYAI